MSLLDGDLQSMFGGALGGLLLEARHYHEAENFDQNGDVSRTVIVTQSVKALRYFTKTDRRPQEFTDRQARLIVLQTYEGRVVTAPEENDRIRLEGQDWRCGNIAEDPAHAAWDIEVTPA